jgi:hypothetical protein
MLLRAGGGVKARYAAGGRRIVFLQTKLRTNMLAMPIYCALSSSELV